MPLFESIAGRAKERFWTDAGGRWREVPYNLFMHAIEQYLDVAEHQVLQTGANHLRRVRPRCGARPPVTSCG